MGLSGKELGIEEELRVEKERLNPDHPDGSLGAKGTPEP